MKIIGLIGGMSWESTGLYYQNINRLTNQKLGGFHSADILLRSVDFAQIEQYQKNDGWNKAGEYLADIAYQLESAGAEVVGLCTNTMHKVAVDIENALSIPFIHIATPTIEQIHLKGIKKITLLGTVFTMEQYYYIEKFEAQNISIIVPEKDKRQKIHHIIFNELCKGVATDQSKYFFIDVIDKLIEQGAEGVILGCTEIGMLISQNDLNIPVFDTMQLHVEALTSFALE